MSKTFLGSYGVIVTPFTADGSAICVDSLKKFLDWQIACKSPGVIILGTTGEFLTVSDDERRQLVEATVAHCRGKMDVLVGTSNAYTPTAVRYAKEAEAAGAQGLMVAPPYYYTPTEDEIFGFYRAVSEAVSIPIMLYNNPFTTNVDMSAKLVAKLTKAFDNVRYIKEASCDLGRVRDIVVETDGVMNVFAGERVVDSFLLGAVGYVNPYANYLPYATTRIWDFLIEGRIEDAYAIQGILHKIDHVIAEGHPTYGHQCYSKALAASLGYPVGDVRPPITQFASLTGADLARRDTVLGLIKDMDALMARLDAK
jgi:4-hydroxy-tetrahydrodipicolinate synthase